MDSKLLSGKEILDTWRAQGADHMDPLRFHYLEALQKRVPVHDGEAKRALQSRLSLHLQAYADALERSASDTLDSECAEALAETSRGTLGRLLEDIARQAGACGGRHAAGDDTGDETGDETGDSNFPKLRALDDFRKIWASVSSDSQARRSLEQSPTNAGPLNSASLVHRSLMLMRDLSPAYLQQFMSYVDALSWLEQLNDSGVLAANPIPKPGIGKVRARSKSRKRSA